MNLNELETKLDEVKQSISRDEEIFLEIRGFNGYEISNWGTVKSADKFISRKWRGNPNKLSEYIFHGRILTPLRTGIDRNWRQVRLTTAPNQYKQVSINKLMLSTFLDIPLEEVPNKVFNLDITSRKINLHDLTFIKSKLYNLIGKKYKKRKYEMED